MTCTTWTAAIRGVPTSERSHRMHTAICTFDTRTTAEQAVERLVQAGFDRDDIHMEYRHSDGSPMREPAVANSV